MTRAQFVQMIGIAESSGKVRAFGDTWRASGMYQMHMEWRSDFWPDWAWQVLALLDRYALEQWIIFDRNGAKRVPVTARALADIYNLGHSAADPAYDARCLAALEHLGIAAAEFDKIVE